MYGVGADANTALSDRGQLYGRLRALHPRTRALKRNFMKIICFVLPNHSVALPAFLPVCFLARDASRQATEALRRRRV